MANPNLLNATSMLGKVDTGTSSTSDTAIVTADADEFIKIISLYLTTDSSEQIMIGVKKSGGSTVRLYHADVDNAIGGGSPPTTGIPAFSVTGQRPIYLEPGDALMLDGEGGAVSYVVSYEEYKSS